MKVYQKVIGVNKSPLIDIQAIHQQTYERDGVVLIKGAFDADWINLLLTAWKRIQAMSPADLYDLPPDFLEIDANLKAEIASNRSEDADRRKVYTEQGAGFVRCKYMRWWVSEFRKFSLESPAAEVIGRVIGSDTVRFFIDAMFMKEPNCETQTYWHSDESAWPVRGSHVPTMWMPLLPVSAELSSLEYVAGSHTQDFGQEPWPNTFNAKMLGQPNDRATFYDWEQRRGDPDVRFMAYDMEPGDVVILHPRMYHGAGANAHPTQSRIAFSTRWFGDDVVWDPRPECINAPGMPFEQMTPGQPVTEESIFPVVWKNPSS
jgi:ectoine hydroxylase-related dioxygenase (phytanoyl-CoA dioxygenase family)